MTALKISSTLVRPALFFALVALVAACAKERDPVDRVQPNAIDKAYFIGEDFTDTRDDPEFYTRNHVIDVGYGASGASEWSLFTATPAEPVARIKWQVTEDYLIGRLAYERIDGSDGKGTPKVDLHGQAVGQATNDGQVVVMFAIDSHFDIVNDYNPTTGEKLNVIEENSEDRPWYERRYMRVDWSKNLNTDSYDFDTLSLLGIYDSIAYEPVSYFVEDPSDDQAPFMDLENGYFDVTTKAFAKPREVDLSALDWGIAKMPACFLANEVMGGSFPQGSCNPVEITLRHSFRRVDRTADGTEVSDYEPRDYDGVRFEHFGGFYTERFGYSRNYGMTDDTWHRLLSRYNIWERSHFYADPEKMTGAVSCDTEATTPAGHDPNRDDGVLMASTSGGAGSGSVISNPAIAGNGTADECEAVTGETGFAGSQCDPINHRCTLPYRARKAKPTPFYYTDTGNPDYFESSALAVHDWDVALRSAVQTAKYTECIRTVAATSTKLPSDWNVWVEEQLEEAGLAAASPTDRDDYLNKNVLNVGGALDTLKAAYRAERALSDQACKRDYPMWTGQMEDQADAVFLALEVDDCRSGRIRADLHGNERSCTSLADPPPTADARSYTAEVRAIAKMPEMLVLCHSPVLFGDPAMCGEKRLPQGVTKDLCIAARNTDSAFEDIPQDIQAIIDYGNDNIKNLEGLVTACDTALRVRHGDLRYHVINVIDKPQNPSPWGIYASSVDPLTGEVIATNCNVWSHVTDMASQALVDKMRLIKGELSFEDVTEAKNVSEWVKAADAASRGGALGTMDRQQLSTRLSSFLINKSDPAFLDELENGRIDGREISDEAGTLQPELMDILKDMRADATTVGADAATYEARRSAAQGTDLEAALMTDAILEKSGVSDLAMNQSVLDMASPLRGGNPTIQRDLKLMMENHLHERNMCMLDADQAAVSPTTLAPLADALEAKFKDQVGRFNKADDPSVQLKRAEQIRKYLAAKLHYGVLAHEIGHSVAHRHNFVGSSDAWSYHPQYWQLRTMDGEITEACNGTEPSGEGCTGPRYVDPITDNERNNFIQMFMISSIMDYPGEVTQNFMGPSIWDFAATRMFYGDAVSVIDEPDFSVFSPGSNMALSKNQWGFGGMIGIPYFYNDRRGSTTLHYSELQSKLGMIRDCRTLFDVAAGDIQDKVKPFVQSRYDQGESGKWHPVLDGRFVAPDGHRYTRCRQQSVDYVNWSSLKVPQWPDVWGDEFRLFDYKERVVEPYTFGTDRWADIGNVSVFRHDNGADLYEILNFLITEKELSYIFDKYRRGRSDFSLRAVSDRALSRYDAKIRDAAKGLAFFRNVISADAEAVGKNPDLYWPETLATWGEGLRSNVVASSYAFDFFARELARPEAGEHGYAAGDAEMILRSEEDPLLYAVHKTAVVIPNGPTGYWNQMSPGGELLENRLAEDRGEFNTDYTLNCGSYYDKINVAMLLTESVDNYISSSRSDFYDPRFRSVSLAGLVPEGYRRLLGNALTNDEFIKGPRVPADESGRPPVKGDLTGDGSDLTLDGPIGWTRWWGQTPTHCFPREGRFVCGDFLGDWTDDAPPTTIPLDSQIGWEEQKFLIAWTLLYLPENEKQEWLDQLRVWELGRDADPGFDNRLEHRHPSGQVYVARTFGTEEIFGKTVQKGIAARVLEYANELMNRAYETAPVLDADGRIIAYEAITDESGKPVVRFDESMDATGLSDGCTVDDNSGCTCKDNRACMRLEDYVSVPMFLRQALDAYRMADPERAGIYD